jgi:hypothetical protein
MATQQGLFHSFIFYQSNCSKFSSADTPFDNARPSNWHSTGELQSSPAISFNFARTLTHQFKFEQVPPGGLDARFRLEKGPTFDFDKNKLNFRKFLLKSQKRGRRSSSQAASGNVSGTENEKNMKKERRRAA